MPSGSVKFLERVQFFNGQRLFASDLQALEEFNREMRWLHNMSLHQPGVGSGFAISGAKGDREVVIQPGYAINAKGQEIVLTETRTEPIPPVANDGTGNSVFFDLTVSYPETGLKESETREGICAPVGAVRLREAPDFSWIRLGPPPDRLPLNATLRDQVRDGMRIRLARAEVLNCQLEQPLSLAQRRNARPAVQPYVSSGRSGVPGWSVPGNASGFGVEISRDVDTSAARFQTTPCYFAHVTGDRVFQINVGNRTITLVLDGFVNVTAATPTSFHISILIPESFLRNMDSIVLAQLPKLLEQNQWQVEWIGVE